MFVHSLRLKIDLPSHSLKGKRGIVKSLLARCRRQFNISAVEAEMHDVPDTAVLAFAIVTRNRAEGRHLLERLEEWVEEERPDVEIVEAEFEER